MASKRTRTRNRRSVHDKPNWLNKPFQLLQNPISPTEWCSADQLDQIHDATMRILENVGLDFMEEEALDLWEKAGAKVDRQAQHVWIDRGSDRTWTAGRSRATLVGMQVGGYSIERVVSEA